MQYLFVVICFLGTVAAMLFVKYLELSAGLTVLLIVPMVFLVIYSMARIEPNEEALKRDTGR